MQNNRKINKRQKSITEFRATYSDNKQNYNSTDIAFRRQAIIKYIIIAVIMAVIALGGFLITDALIGVSEAPYKEEPTTAIEEKTTIAKKYFDNGVTVPADKINETNTDIDVRE